MYHTLFPIKFQENIVHQKNPFNTDDRQRNTSDTSDVEYKENTNTLYIKKQRTYNMEENIPSATAMSEEEIFKRLHEERH